MVWLFFYFGSHAHNRHLAAYLNLTYGMSFEDWAKIACFRTDSGDANKITQNMTAAFPINSAAVSLGRTAAIRSASATAVTVPWT